ncbi:hypothetical protein ACQEVC_10875 [Plantactinospora sp. CA-294935]|uniref:hypothetical protein n=1 Tax=Plantactinospora sp. CA-294935 TaxID=3240012 RepID=UPI003D8D8876
MLAAEEIPKITDWMQAWTGIAALIMSTFAVLFTGLLLRHEIKIRREEKRDQEAAQARLITLTRPYEETEEEFVTTTRCQLINHSAAPIHGIQLYARDRRQPAKIVAIKMIHLLAPGDTTYFDVPVPDGPAHKDTLSFLQIRVSFIDSNGMGWERYMGGQPTRDQNFVGRREAGEPENFGLVLWRYLWPVSEPVGWLGRRRRDLGRRIRHHMYKSTTRHANKHYNRMVVKEKSRASQDKE